MRKIEGHVPYEFSDDEPEYLDNLELGFPVPTFRKLVEHVATLSYYNKDYQLFFRGQSKDYLNKGGSSTFYPTIYRGEYLSKSELSNRFTVLAQASKMLVDRFHEASTLHTGDLERKKLVQWSILQHYEVCSTPLLDFTQSLRVAASFAQLNTTENTAYVFAFGLPYPTNRISHNSEHDLVNIRLLSICPPEALRPHFQEGYLAATEDIETEYISKTELDFNNRLITKFKIPTGKEFWGRNFNPIPRTALYPAKDKVKILCDDIAKELDFSVSTTDMGVFLKEWSEIEKYIKVLAKREGKEPFMRSLQIVKERGLLDSHILSSVNRLRKFRNTFVHAPLSVDTQSIIKSMKLLSKVKEYMSSIKR